MVARTFGWRPWAIVGFVHRWSSLISTLFLLLLCLSGMPLVFHHEIAELDGSAVEVPKLPADHPRASFGKVLAAARAQMPGHYVQFISREIDDDRFWYVSLGESPTSDYMANKVVAIDARTARPLPMGDPTSGFMWWMVRLHIDLFAGFPGKLLLGFMALMLVLSLLSGALLYGPFMRKLPFGTVRRERGTRIQWLDLHNLVGIVTAGWLMVVGITGIINAWGDLLIGRWQAEVLAPLTSVNREQTLVTQPVSLDIASSAVKHAVQGMSESLIAFPGSSLASSQHFVFFMAGDTPLTERLRLPVLVDARSAEVVHAAPPPWHLATLMVSQPLHFGDYGGLPLKLLWALFDIAAIVLLGSGVYLWFRRGRGREPRE